jgi:hypothetical protein
MGDLMRYAQAYKIWLVFVSYSDDFFLHLRELIMLFISASVIGIIFMLGKFQEN